MTNCIIITIGRKKCARVKEMQFPLRAWRRRKRVF